MLNFNFFKPIFAPNELLVNLLANSLLASNNIWKNTQ